MTDAVLTVERVGVRGDGVAHHAGTPVYLPLTAPGDVVRARLGARRGGAQAGEVLAFERQVPRPVPACPHFGACGGCSLQHLDDAAYAAAKTEWLTEALRHHGFTEFSLRPLRRLAAGTRRRARFALARPRDGTTPLVGFHARQSHHVVDMHRCAVLHPTLLALVPRLRMLAATMLSPGENGAATATVAESGIDLLLDLPSPPGLPVLEAMVSFAHDSGLARLAWRGEGGEPVPVVVLRPVRVTFGKIAVDLPYDSFRQASVEADSALTEAVLRAADGAERIADLFAGVGTFSPALVGRGPVHAVEADPAAVTALGAAAARGQVQLTVERRDLERRPLRPEELARFDTVVFDPPRAGAKAQSEMLARSSVRRVVAVSCNPATFARDARILVEGGFRLDWVEPFDCFAWSAHLELVARFERRLETTSSDR